jgi:hypothetical protein
MCLKIIMACLGLQVWRSGLATGSDYHKDLEVVLRHFGGCSGKRGHIMPTSVADPGCLSRIRFLSIPDPGTEFSHPRSRIRIKEFRYFNPKNSFQTLRNMIRFVHPGSRIRILTFYPSRTPDPDPQH